MCLRMPGRFHVAGNDGSHKNISWSASDIINFNIVIIILRL
jgi:hypothetical protein